ncbi:hypothetical protein [Micromonospora parathelypteridis]
MRDRRIRVGVRDSKAPDAGC